MTKLTDTQLIVLSSAAQHDEGLATRPANLNAAAAAKVALSLLQKGLMREIRAKADAPVWHENDDGRFASKITKAGREAIGVQDDEEQHAAELSATLDASEPKKSRSKRAAKDAAKTPVSSTKGARQKTAGDPKSTAGQIRSGSKQATIVNLMKRAKGATLDEMIEATDWLPHTTRAALTGLRKRGFALERINDDTKGSVYRIKSDRAPVAA
jgi:septum formation inhibitor MinC